MEFWEKTRWVVILLLIALLTWRVNSKSYTSDFEKKYGMCSLGQSSRVRMDCFMESFKGGFLMVGTRGLLSELESSFNKNDNADGGGITKCHDATHAIGMLAGMSSRDLQSTFAQCSNMCGYGCHMGVIEGYFDTNPGSFDNFWNLCKTSSHVYSCVHAVGHYIGHKTQNVSESLAVCDKIVDLEYRGHCTSGVFMELFDQPIHSDVGNLIPNNIPEFCKTLSGVHKSFCFTMSGFYEYLSTGDFVAGVDMCLNSPQEDVCITNYSKSLFYHMNGSAPRLYDFCKSVPTHLLRSCQSGVINASLLSDPILRHGLEFCSLYPSDDKLACLSELGSLVQNSPGGSRLKREAVCSRLNEEDRQVCMK